MVEDVGVTAAFTGRICGECSVLFMVAKADLEVRRKHGRSLFCPNGHETRLAPEGEVADLRWQLNAALVGWEDDRHRLTTEIDELRKQLAADAAKPTEVEKDFDSLEGEVTAAQPSPPNEAPADSSPPWPAPTWRDQVDPKTCKECGALFGPNPKVPQSVWEGQEFCKRQCRIEYHKREAKERTKEAKRQESSPPANAVQDANEGPTGLEQPAADQTSPPETPARPTTPIPGHFSLARELAKQGVTTVEQVEATTDEELLELPRLSKPKLAMLRSQIIGTKQAASAADRKEPSAVSESLSLPDAVQHAENDRSVKADVQSLETLQPEAPTLTDPAYGGPPAPESVAEELEPVLDQAAEQVAGQAEQVASEDPVAKPRRSVGPEPTESKPDKSVKKALSPGEPKPGERKPDKPEPSKNAEKPSMANAGEPERPPPPPPDQQPKLPDPRPVEKSFNLGRYDETRVPEKRLSPKDDEHIETLEEVRARSGEVPPLSEEEEKKLDEQLRRELAALLEACPELLEEFRNWHAQVERAAQATETQVPKAQHQPAQKAA